MKSLSLALLFVTFMFADVPKMPFRDSGACPFECCHYGDWVAESPAVARKKEDSKSPQVFQINKGDRVKAITGVVITKKPGTVRNIQETKLGDFVVPKGTLFYTLHQGGEGSTLFWFKGKARWADLYADSIHAGTPEYPWEVLSLPEAEWWVKVRTSSGRAGWILNPMDFKGMDSCGV
jgi:hypothetical protein